jgi:purine-binding chemotaxis protein CheW
VSDKVILSRIAELEASLLELRRELIDQKAGNDAAIDALTFTVRQKEYAIFLSDVVEVLRMVKWSPLPKAPPDIQGVINCRGAILPLLNPGLLFGNEPLDPTLASALVVVSAAGQQIAIIVESVVGVQQYQGKELTSVAEAQKKHRTLPPFIVGFIKREGDHTAVIDVNQMLGAEDHRVLGVALRERDEWGQF